MAPDALLPVFIALPLIVAAITAISPWRALNSALGLIIPAVNLAGGIWLYAHTAEHGTIGHVIGLYPGGAGIALGGDQFSAIMLITTMLVALISNWFAIISGETHARYYTPLSLVLLTGVSGALLTADLFNFFVMIEVMLLPSYGLIAMTGTRHRLQSARLFVLVNLSASTFLLIGVGFVYAVTGAVNIGALKGAAAGNGPVTVAMGIVVVAVCAKAAVFPLHTWLPRTYTSTSAAVMGLFSGLHTKVAVYMLFRIWVVIFDMDQMVNGMPFILVMLAFTQEDPRYALAAGLMYTLHHMITIGALTLNSGAIEETYGTGTISKLSGLARRDPLAAWVFAAGAFSVIGFPPFSGLWGKLTLVFAAARGGDARSWVVIAAIIIASFGAMLAMFRVWREVFWGKPMQRFPGNLKVRGALLAPSASLMLISLAMFLAAGPLWGAATDSIDALLDVDSYSTAVLGPDPVGVPDTANLQGGQ